MTNINQMMRNVDRKGNKPGINGKNDGDKISGGYELCFNKKI